MILRVVGSARQASGCESGRVLVLKVTLTVLQSDRQVRQAGRLTGFGKIRLDQSSCVHQAFVWVQAGKESDVSVLVGLQSHHSLFQLIRVATAWILKVSCTQNSVSGNTYVKHT